LGGFLNVTLNSQFKYGLFEIIIERLLRCSELMVNDCIVSGRKIGNHEEKIRTYLVEQYLNNDVIQKSIYMPNIHLRFIAEAQENYSDIDETYSGRADIKVVTENWFRNDNRDYYLIECKRIDGNKRLNEKYVNEGIARFVVSPIKYLSYHYRNIMFGFVVRNIEVARSVSQINSIQAEFFGKMVEGELAILREVNDECCLYSSSYRLNDCSLEIRHIFYNFTQILKK
jgi:hypothetical protein